MTLMDPNSSAPLRQPRLAAGAAFGRTCPDLRTLAANSTILQRKPAPLPARNAGPEETGRKASADLNWQSRSAGVNRPYAFRTEAGSNPNRD